MQSKLVCIILLVQFPFFQELPSCINLFLTCFLHNNQNGGTEKPLPNNSSHDLKNLRPSTFEILASSTNSCKMALGLSTSSYWEVQGQCLLLPVQIPTFCTSREGPRNSGTYKYKGIFVWGKRISARTVGIQKKMGVATHISEIVDLKFGKKKLYILMLNFLE